MSQEFLMTLLFSGCRWGQRGNPAIRRIGDDGRSKCLDYLRAEFAPCDVVGPDVLRRRLARRFFVACGCGALPIRRFFRSEELLVLELRWTLQWSRGG